MNKVIVDPKVMKRIAELLIDKMVMPKNHDYGDAWQNNGIFTPLLRIDEKLVRIQTLSNGLQALVAKETPGKDVMDIFGYSMLSLLQMYSLIVTGKVKPEDIFGDEYIPLPAPIHEDLTVPYPVAELMLQAICNSDEMGMDMASGPDQTGYTGYNAETGEYEAI